jgi:hypothetical protein
MGKAIPPFVDAILHKVGAVNTKGVDQDTFIETWHLCPFCRSGSDFYYDNLEQDGAFVWQKVRCNSCEREWIIDYRLEGYEEIKR